MHNSFITEPKRRSRPVSIILYGSSSINRMTSFGPKSLFKIENKTIIEKQVESVQSIFIKNEFIVCGGFQFNKLINNDLFRLVENQLYTTTNECEDIRIALNACSHKNILLIDQSTLLGEKAFKCDYKTSFILSEKDNNSDYIGVNHHENIISSLHYNSNEMKWKNITFINEDSFPLFKSILDTNQYKFKFLFELINSSIDLGLNMHNQIPKNKIITIFNSKQLRNENTNI